MSLYDFHAFLISTAILFFAGFGGWVLKHPANFSHRIWEGTVAGSFGLALLLFCYLLWFLRKVKGRH